ncbi:putative oral cancer-overexpressed protein 1-like [Apostichopus japonicus]|uniref:Putative oral cancer-overexpressed protein 1-like n=1 Tax=Stichopus japonicus TaxID=307972 RepID=A0A2G8JGB9_STIJA|nr:putative oral cancer-overexpressed protein 1-like [Apostichopus japonicus]
MTSVDDEGDFLDTVFMAEDRLQQDGYDEGYEVGRKAGLVQGQEAGRQKANQIGGEIGFYNGCVHVWIAVIQKEEVLDGKERKLKALQGLKALLDGFQVHDISREDYWDNVTKIRAKFKQVSSLLKIPTEFINKSAATGLSF